jgi:hypothetical protein
LRRGARAVANDTVSKVQEDGSREERWEMHRTDAGLLNVVNAFRNVWADLVTLARPEGASAPARHQFLMIRCVSALADAEGNTVTKKRWRAYALDVVTAYTIGLLRWATSVHGVNARANEGQWCSPQGLTLGRLSTVRMSVSEARSPVRCYKREEGRRDHRASVQTPAGSERFPKRRRCPRASTAFASIASPLPGSSRPSMPHRARSPRPESSGHEEASWRGFR